MHRGVPWYAARDAGASYVQRSNLYRPPNWKHAPRVWSRWPRDGWPLATPQRLMQFFADPKPTQRQIMRLYWRWRRIVRNWRIDDARSVRQYDRLSQARRMLRCGDRRRIATRGLSEWMPYPFTAYRLASTHR